MNLTLKCRKNCTQYSVTKKDCFGGPFFLSLKDEKNTTTNNISINDFFSRWAI